MNKKTDLRILIEGQKIRSQPWLPSYTKLMKKKTLTNQSENNQCSEKILPLLTPTLRNNKIHCFSERKKNTYKENNPFVYLNSIETIPITPNQSYYNLRIFWNKRKLVEQLPLLIINFEGVVGDYYKPNFWAEGKKEFYFRKNAIHGINLLKSEFFIVLVVSFAKIITEELTRILHSKGLRFDAIYMKRHKKRSSAHSHNISSILEDFNVLKMNVLFLSALGLDQDEVNIRTGFDLIYENTISTKKRFLTYNAPVCDNEIPVTVLISHFRLNRNPANFFDIVKFLFKLKSYSDFFAMFSESLHLKKIVCNLPESNKDFFVPVHCDIVEAQNRLIFITTNNPS